MPARYLLFALILLGAGLAVPVLAADNTPGDAPSATQPAASPGADAADGGEAMDAPPRDVVLVLDNSGSMKKNDPEFLAAKAVREFVSRLNANTRLAIEIFDQDVRLVMPLTPVTQKSREQIIRSLQQVNYKGLFTDSPSAIERAIYELKNNGRKGARKFIVFMTDGIVDTGNAEKNAEKTRWLREDLAPDAAQAKIRIFGIAFTEDADFQLIQTLAQKTGGDYFRALQPGDLKGVFERISSTMDQPPQPKATKPAPAPQPQARQPSPQPAATAPLQPPVLPVGREEHTRNLIIITAAGVLIIALLSMIVVLIRRGRELKVDVHDPAIEAYLNDIHGYTSQASYKLGSKPTMLGRVAGKDTEHLDYIVIPESTIGRRHALIEYKDFAYWIVDQGSINGTFVNDVPINSEVRLKHGDRIRLHKLEFEFIMPEMDDAGMTVMSKTVFAREGGGMENESTVLKETAGPSASGNVDQDHDFFDLETGERSTTDAGEITVMPHTGGGGATKPGYVAYDPEDETFLPGSEETENSRGGNVEAKKDTNIDSEDETLLPSELDVPDEDETLRQSEESLENFVDLTGVEDEKKDKED
ncbi:MAG: VWA domain-containing protein [Gammaproteobacteria bacterium]